MSTLKKTHVTLILILLAQFLTIHSCAGTKTVSDFDWGHIPENVLLRDSYEMDTTAVACVVFDIGRMELETYPFNMIFRRHQRIQIFREAGKEYADIRIPYWYDETITNIKAQTILPNGQKITLKRKDIHDEGEAEGWRYKVFAMPGVQNNCVIECQYEYTTEHISLLDPWFFQGELYTELSSITICVTQGYHYGAHQRNTPVVDYKPSESIVYNPDQKKRKEYTWEFANLPPIKDEPYITTPIDYLASLHFQLRTYKDPYISYTFIQTWKDLKKKILPSYQSYLRRNSTVRILSNRITADQTSSETIVQLLYNFVRDSIETSAYHGYWGTVIGEPRAIVRTRKGSRVEKNLLLLSLLGEAGIKAEPVLISTRSHGRVDTWDPRFDSFNHLIVYIGRIRGGLFVDASNAYCPYYLLPPNDYTDMGWLINREERDFIDIPAPKATSANFVEIANGMLDERGNLKATVQIRYDGHRNVIIRDILTHSKSDDDFIKDVVLADIENASIDTFEIHFREEKDTPLAVRINFTVDRFADVAGNNIYFSPALFYRYDENPFQAENRTYPVEYNFPFIDQESISLSLPAGYNPVELPQRVSHNMRGQEFKRQVYIKDNQLHYIRRLYVNELTFRPHEYERLRNFYSYIVDVDRDQVVLTSAP